MAVNCPFEVRPYDISEPISTTNIANFNYTNQDFWSIKSRLINFINEKFSDDFNDFVESSLAIMLMENFAFIGDTLSFKIDQIANEIFIDTVTEIDNAFRLSKLVGFDPLPPIASKSMWTATTNKVLTEHLTIPTPYTIESGTNEGAITIELFPADSDDNPILDEDIVVPAGKTTISNIVGLEGVTIEAFFEGDGSIGQTVLIPNLPIIYQSVRVYVEGVQWDQVEYFTDSQPRREFRLEYNPDYSAYVVFGNNRAGMIPSEGAEIKVVYRVGGGTRGNIVTGGVTAQGAIGIDVFPFGVAVEFTNYTKGEYGYNGDGIEEIRQKLPRYIRTQDRAVTGTDYKTLADQFASVYHGQVGKSTAVLRNYGCAANIIDLYILAKDGSDGLEEASNELKVDLQNELDEKKMFTDELCIRDGVIIEVDVSLDVTVARARRKYEEEIRTRIVRRIDSFFALNNWEYGQDLKDTDIIKILSDVREVTNSDITLTTSDPDNSGLTVTADFNEIIRYDDVTISFIYE